MLYEVLHAIVPPVARAVWRPTIEGLENVPMSGPVLIASNHLASSGLGMVPVDRSDTQAALKSLDIALEVLGRGEAFGIYPEGTRSRDGKLYRGRTGIAQLALTAGVPVVPVGLIGTEDLQPVDGALPRRAKVTVRFGKPLDFTGRFDGVAPGRARRQVTDEIMDAIHALTGQERVEAYNERPIDA